eukprot:scaffold7878_cov126-Isochrysis_galbana.AAC.8
MSDRGSFGGVLCAGLGCAVWLLAGRPKVTGRRARRAEWDASAHLAPRRHIALQAEVHGRWPSLPGCPGGIPAPAPCARLPPERMAPMPNTAACTHQQLHPERVRAPRVQCRIRADERMSTKSGGGGDTGGARGGGGGGGPARRPLGGVAMPVRESDGEFRDLERRRHD